MVSARLDKSKPAGTAIAATPTQAQKVRDIADFWGGIRQRIQAFEAALAPGTQIAIYGAGIYGNFIFSCLKSPERVGRFLDQNRFLTGTRIKGIEVVHPGDLPDDITTVLVGLNPKHARRIIAEVPGFAGRDLEFFYLG